MRKCGEGSMFSKTVILTSGRGEFAIFRIVFRRRDYILIQSPWTRPLCVVFRKKQLVDIHKLVPRCKQKTVIHDIFNSNRYQRRDFYSLMTKIVYSQDAASVRSCGWCTVPVGSASRYSCEKLRFSVFFFMMQEGDLELVEKK